MLDLGPYLRRPASTLASIASDPLEAWIRFSEQFAASRETPAPPNLYGSDPDWESRLLRGLDGSASERLNAEFWALWPKVIDELAAKGIRAGPASFKGWNDGDAGFVRAIWILARRLKPRTVIETGVAHGVTSRFILRLWNKTGPANSSASTVRRSNRNGKTKSASRWTTGSERDGPTFTAPAGGGCRA